MNLEQGIGLLNWLALGWFVLCWVAYSQFAKYMARRSASLSSVMHIHRINWMKRVLQREVRVGDAALLANIERNANFFASSCVLVIAGLLTAMASVEELQEMLSGLSFTEKESELALEFKLGVLIVIYIYGFFIFTWSMRQFGFASVIVGAAPTPGDNSVTAAERRSYAIYGAKVIDQAGHSYNYGLRAFYFSLAVLPWFINPWAFMVSTALVIGILYEREFLSSSLQALKQIESVGDKLTKNDKELSD